MKTHLEKQDALCGLVKIFRLKDLQGNHIFLNEVLAREYLG